MFLLSSRTLSTIHASNTPGRQSPDVRCSNLTPSIRVWVSSSRLKCAMNGDFEDFSSSAAAYAWFVWEKVYKGETTVKWFN